MKQLYTSDLHITSKAEDAYRWEVFSKLREILTDFKIEQLIITGDLTEEKDRHSSGLVNRMMEELHRLSQLCPKGVFILEGNHDFSLTGEGYWRFSEWLPEVFYIKDPGYCKLTKAYHVPYGCELPESYDKGDVLVMHDLVMGATYQNTPVKKGISLQKLPKLTISGHIHKPQQVLKRRGCVFYVGSPHSVDFGDHFDPRVLIRETEDDSIISVPLHSTVKWSVKIKTVQELDQYSFLQGDFVKVGLEVEPEKVAEIKEEVKQYLQEKAVTFSGFTINKMTTTSLKEHSCGKELPTFENYCEENRLSEDYVELAKTLMQ